MDSYSRSILLILGSVTFVGMALLTSQEKTLQGAITVDMEEYTFYSNKQFLRDPLRTAINTNCPSGVEQCTTAGCACAPGPGQRMQDPAKATGEVSAVEGILYG